MSNYGRGRGTHPSRRYEPILRENKPALGRTRIGHRFVQRRDSRRFGPQWQERLADN